MSGMNLLISKMAPVLQIVFSLVWLSNLSMTDAYFSVYVLIAFASFFLQIRWRERDEIRGIRGLYWPSFLAAVFSLLVLLANYPLFTTIGDPALIGHSTSILMNVINSFLSLLGGYCVFHPILQWIFCSFPRRVDPTSRWKLARWILPAVFLSFVCINLVHLFLVEYPGNATEDTFTQISEMVDGSYSNFNTFWHTMLFRGVLSLGYAVFSDINAAVACFCIFQILVLSLGFTYSLATIAEYGAPKGYLIAAYLIYALIPYNIALSVTIWKDVLFAAGSLLLITAWVRIFNRIGRRKSLDYFLFGLGSLIFLVSRTNGWIIYLASFGVTILCSKHKRRFLSAMGSFALAGWFMMNPLLALLNIPEGDIVESLSIPIQQVSRVIAEGCELSEDDTQLLSRVVDLEEVPELYVNWLSDPMKVEVRSKDAEYFISHLSEYRELWIRLGIRHPWQYVKAWVDQTKGYWNAGYDYALYSETITDNPYGVQKLVSGNPAASMFRLYFGLSRHVIFFEPLHSIGLCVWLLLLCLILNIKKKREHFVVMLPLVFLTVGLWFGTPVYSCFRYVYPLFVSIPLILSITLYSPEG